MLRVVRTDATDDPAAVAARGEAEWFMDYRNADGSVVGDVRQRHPGVRAATSSTHERRRPAPTPLPVATRAGVKTLTFDGDG